MARDQAELFAAVRAAFEAAKASGRPGWDAMSSAVLKNRLLQASGGSFHEADWGAETFGGLLMSGQLDEILEVDATVRPMVVRLRDADPEPASASASASAEPGSSIGVAQVIRGDLWRALLAARGPRFWSPARGAVVDTAESGAVLLPAVTSDATRAWREEYVAGLPERDRDALAQWVTDGSPDLLPRGRRGPWFAALKARVHAILLEFFEAQSLPPPEDLLVDKAHVQEPEVVLLRRLVTKVVGQMTLSELQAVPLPAQAVARMMRGRP